MSNSSQTSATEEALGYGTQRPDGVAAYARKRRQQFLPCLLFVGLLIFIIIGCSWRFDSR